MSPLNIHPEEEIAMPKKIAFDMYRGYMDKMKAETQGTDRDQPVQTASAAVPAAPAGMPSGMPATPAVGAPAMPPAGGAPTAAA